MGMNLNDVRAEGSKYIKPVVDIPITVRFSDNFEKSKGEKDGRTFVSFNCDCQVLIEGKSVEKVWSGSSNFYDRCAKKAEEMGMSFSDCNFEIIKRLVDNKTNWDIGILNPPIEAPLGS